MEETEVEETNIISALDTPKEEPEQRVGGWEDAFNTMSSPAIVFNNPSLDYKAGSMTGRVDIEDPTFKSLYEAADGEGKKALAGAHSLDHAIVIAGRREIFADSSKATAENPLHVQLGMGVVAGMVNFSSAIPMGYLGATVKLGKQVSRARNLAMGVGFGAATGATLNVADEALFEAQGMQHDYLSAFAIGLGLGGALGGIGGALAGPYKKGHAEALSSDGDTFTKDFDRDPDIIVDIDENGIPRIVGQADIAQQSKFGLDYIPYFGKFFRSDVHTVFQDPSQVLRTEGSKFSNATVAHRDNTGKVLPSGWTAQNEKGIVQGLNNTNRVEIMDVYTRARADGYKGSYDDYVQEVSTAYTNASSRQEIAVNTKLIPEAQALKKKSNEEVRRLTKEHSEEQLPKVKDEATGKERDLTEDEYILTENDRVTQEAYTRELEDVESWNQGLVDDIADELQTLRESKKFSNQELADIEAELVAKTAERIEVLPIAPIKTGPEVTLKNHTARKQVEFAEALKEKYQLELDEAIRKRTNELYAKYKPEFEGSSFIREGGASYQKFFSSVLEKGQEANLGDLSNISSDRLYRPRTWNFAGISNGDVGKPEAISRLTKALTNHPNQAGMTKQELDEAAEYIYRQIEKAGFNLDSMTTTFAIPDSMPFEGMLRSRKYKLDESQLGDMLKDQLEDLSGAYTYKMSGRIAVSKATDGRVIDGDSKREYFTEVQEKMLDEGTYTKDGLQAFQRVVDDTLGTLRMNPESHTPKWTWTRNIMAANSARLGTGFGGNQFIELGANVAMLGVRSMVNGRMGAVWKNQARMLYRGRKADDAYSNAMVAAGFLETSLHTSRVNRYSDAEMGLNPGFWEKKLHGVQDVVMKGNGMRYFTSVMEDYTGGAIMTNLSAMAKKESLSNADIARLGRWGFNHQSAREFAKDLDMYYKPKEGIFELEKFSPQNQTKFQMAIQNGVSEMVVQGDSIHAPNWMKFPQPALKLMTQFMRFPLIAQETLMRRGWQEDQALFYSGLVSSTMIFMGLKYVREQIAIQAGWKDEMDAKYDYFGRYGEEAIRRGVLQSFNYNANLGFMSSLWNKGAILSGNPELGNDYAYGKGVGALLGGPTGGIVDDFNKLTTSAAEGTLGSDKDQMVLMGWAPKVIPQVQDAFSSFIKD